MADLIAPGFEIGFRGRLFATAVICVFVVLNLAIADANAASPAPDLRPATTTEIAAMTSQLALKSPGSSIIITSAKVTAKFGIGVAYVEVDSVPNIGIFDVYPDGNAGYDYLSTGADCASLREAGIDDITSETLAIVESDFCSEGLPRHLPRSTVAALGKKRLKVNATISAMNRCGTNSCVRRRHRQSYVPAVRRLITRLTALESEVSWSGCFVGLDHFHDAADAHRNALSDILRANARSDYIGQSEAEAHLRSAARKAKTAWNEVRAECIYYRPN